MANKSKKKRNDVAMRSTVAKNLVVKEVKDETFTPDVLVNGIGYNFEKFFKLKQYKGEYVFPNVEKIKHIQLGPYVRSYKEIPTKCFCTNSVTRATKVCGMCILAKERGFNDLYALVDPRDGEVYMDDRLDMYNEEFVVFLYDKIIQNKNLYRAIKADDMMVA